MKRKHKHKQRRKEKHDRHIDIGPDEDDLELLKENAGIKSDSRKQKRKLIR